MSSSPHAVRDILDRLGVAAEPRAVAVGAEWKTGTGQRSRSRCPIDGTTLAELALASSRDVAPTVTAAADSFRRWRTEPAPRRGELVRRIGLEFRAHKEDLALLVSYEAGKIREEGRGEVQEIIDICDFAVGLSRQLYGLTIASERREHRLAEQWHPLGPIGVITAFNFPMAVWAWNAMLALVCGDTVIWKPSEKTPLCAIACQTIVARVGREFSAPPGLSSLVVGAMDVGQALASHHGVPLVSATGSVRMGRAVAQTVAARLGRTLLELGGNNGAIVAPTASLELTLRAIVFSAVGTCGQRCTSLRRLIVERSIASTVLDKLLFMYSRLPIGDPLHSGMLVGPLIDEQAFNAMQRALATLRASGAVVHGGERVAGTPHDAYYVRPAIVEVSGNEPIVAEETFAPILYFMRYDELEQAIAINNSVSQGLSSAIFTSDVREAERFCSASGSDCGIANVNMGTSGAEIGGAFGGEKDTGGGRESGSDAWKAYMRRATNTINYSRELPLAQGIRFDLD
ncbi:MAG TPA: aldehyde dehydrogenase family protein [Gammaproteobacteria bacterium]|jgi:aldehyde dehydrogenase (NAD+)